MWRVEHWQNDTTKVAITAGDLLAMVDLFLKADIRFDRPRYATGQRALVTCQISAGGEPVRDARVDVELARPGQGLGTYLGARGQDYKPGKPKYPDPLAPKAAMLQTLLGREDRQGLPIDVVTKGIFRDGTSGLWDDGLHRDGPAGDGTYSNTFAGVDKEGVYTWRFTITGTTADGHPFARVATRTFHSGVAVDPNNSKVNVTLGERGERRTATITVAPVDRAGELLGPFRASDVEILSRDGEFLPFDRPGNGVVYPQPDKGDLLSLYDGRYARVLSYDPKAQPVVTVTVQGRRFPDIRL